MRPRRGSHLGRPNRPSPSLCRGVSKGPLTRGPVRLLGPCFKTGRAGAQLRSATRGATCRLTAPAASRPSATTENSERRGGLRGTGGAAPPEGGGRGSRPFLGNSVGVATDAISSPEEPEGPRRSYLRRCLRPTWVAGPERRVREKCTRRPPPPGAARSLRIRDRAGTAADALNLHGPVPRVLPVCFLAVSRPLELSLQSSFQLSLTVLVCYRSRASILALDGVHHPSLGSIPKLPDSWWLQALETRRPNGPDTRSG